MTITEWLKEGFEKAFPGVELPEIKAVPATDPKFGDYQCNDALKIAKKAGFRNPREAAQPKEMRFFNKRKRDQR